MGTTALPSTGGMEDLPFFPEMPAAFNPAGANRPPDMVPTAARNDRRFQPNFRFMRSALSTFFANYRSAGGVGGLTIIALPTISISESPGIHSTAMHARDGALPEEK